MIDGGSFWYWWVFGVVLVVLEILLPGAILLWMGVSAFAIGALLYVIPAMSWEMQWLGFALLSVVAIFAWRQRLKNHPTETDQPNLNRRGEQYVGRVFTLDNPIVNGVGKVKVDDSTWKIEGDDCAAGSRVKVVGIDGVVFRVELTH